MKSKINIHLLFVLSAAFLWGLAGIYVRNLKALNITEMEIVFGRAFFTSVILGGIILIKNPRLFKVKPCDLWIFTLGGVGSIVLFNYSYYTTMRLTNSLGIASVLLYTAPFFVVFIYRIFFGKKLSVKTLFSCVLAFLGCLAVSGVLTEGKNFSLAAIAMGLLTGFGYALYTVVGDLALKRGYPTLTITFYVFLFAAVGSLPFINPVTTINELSLESVIWLLLMAVFNTVLPYILYTNGLLGVDSTTAPIIATLEPAVAAIMGALCYEEYPDLIGVAGMILILTSVVILNMNTSSKLKLKACAKINLSLYIKGKRDDGYHLIDTVMQSVDLYDDITVKRSGTLSVLCSDGEIPQENNIAFKAAKLFFETTDIDGGAEIYIEKKIPVAAGLGGGSGDAAAVLLALDRIYKTDLSYDTLCEMAVKLGADVPFFIKGGTQRAENIGEKLTALKSFTAGYFVLAKRDSKPSTKEMYTLLDSKDYGAIDMESAVAACENNDLSTLCRVMNNSFLSVWEENTLAAELEAFSPLGVCLSGSGPTFFAVFDKESKAKKCRDALIKDGIEAFVCRPCKDAIIFDE